MSDNQINKVLGQKTEYPTVYDPSILVREERLTNRRGIGINNDNLPFVGFDTWNAYEISTLNRQGFPVTGVAKIVYSSDSKYIVESKSLKLYLNSFNMTASKHHNIGDVLSDMEDTIEKDLSDFLETDVQVCIQTSVEVDRLVSQSVNLYNRDLFSLQKHNKDDFYQGGKIGHYSETPEILKNGDRDHEPLFFHSSLLFSRCKVTSQPDHGDVYIMMLPGSNGTVPTIDTVLKYITSFRDECHFHEEICETIYTRLWEIFKPNSLVVTCLYTRRGGIDICPSRASAAHLLPYQSLGDIELPHVKTPRQ